MIEDYKLYQNITKAIGVEFAVVKDGFAYKISEESLEEIPKAFTAYLDQIHKGEGKVFRLTEATCGGSCSIGVPNPNCLGSAYVPSKCSVYHLHDVDGSVGLAISHNGLLKILELEKAS